MTKNKKSTILKEETKESRIDTSVSSLFLNYFFWLEYLTQKTFIKVVSE